MSTLLAALLLLLVPGQVIEPPPLAELGPATASAPAVRLDPPPPPAEWLPAGGAGIVRPAAAGRRATPRRPLARLEPGNA